MTRLIYLANARLPSEKANSYQIMQMCEAFADEGLEVILLLPYRVNDQPETRGVRDPWAYYGVRANFRLIRLPSFDLIWLLDNRAAHWLQSLSFIWFALLWLAFRRYDWLFSRDPFVMATLSLFFPRPKLIYEVHHKFRSPRGQKWQAWLMRRVGRVVSLTGSMAAQLQALGRAEIIIAHDGIRPERFAGPPPYEAARAALGISPGDFIACYAGRLHTMDMDKGLELLVKAAPQVPGLRFLLVGGPAEDVEKLRALWEGEGLHPADFMAQGSVPPSEVPRYLAAADVCLITSPQNEFFAHETSPMKLFEYMMAGRAIIASDLPSTREVVRHGQSAYLIPPSDSGALAAALNALRQNPDLRAALARQAQKEVLAYTWKERARRILGPGA
jgi:glycosyltransferase involved in cell wall biosynthesis